MSKVSGSYDSVVLGVSQQVAQERRSGQHEEQVNMISDTVNGLSRRRGSVWKDEMVLSDITAEDPYQSAQAELGAMREYTFVIDGNEYCILFRNRDSTLGDSTFMVLYDKANNAFIPIEYENSSWIDNLILGGASCMANVGRYVYIAGNNTLPEIDIADVWGVESNLEKMVAWVRGGAYSRTFKLKLTKTDNTIVEVEYKTKPSAYPTLLDTSGISFFEIDGVTPRDDYQKDINDAVYAYNSAVNAYIGEAAEDITGENIAQKLVDELVLLGIAASRTDSTVVIEDADFIDIAADDGGDNTLLRAVGREVAAPTLMSTVHYVGKIVRIRPQGASDREAYYLQAYAKDDVTTGWGEVIWRESAGVVQTPTHMFAQAIIHEGVMYVAQNGAGLTALAPTSGTHPEFKPNPVGDAVSSPTPEFYGKKITMMSVFQDRLLIGSSGIVNASRPGDYLNFFRHTVLNIQDDDPIEMFAYGAEGDTLRSAVMYDKDLLIFGDRKQYGITGRQVLSAKSPNITLVSAHEGATSAYPVANGNFVFYGKSAEGDDGDTRTTLHQIQTGQALTESPVSRELSEALNQYIQGTPAQIIALTSPNMVLYRTEEVPHDIYTYQYLDDAGGTQRLVDAWSRWSFSTLLGRVVSVSHFNGAILIFTLREKDGQVYIVADKQSLNTKLGALPYLDSMRPFNTEPVYTWHDGGEQYDLALAFGRTSDSFLIGANFGHFDEMIEQYPDETGAMWYGAISPGYVTPTNPFLRDAKGRPVLNGRLTLNTVTPSVTETSGLIATVTTVNGSIVTREFQGRILGFNNNIINEQPVTTTQVVVSVGKEVRECSYTLASKDWLPLTITSLEWAGQSFNRVRRAG